MLPLSRLLLGSPPATAEDPQDPPPAITEVYRVPDAEAPSGEVRLVQVGSEEDPRSTLLVETGAGLQVVEVGLDGAHATPLGLTTSPRPGKGLRRVDDLYWFGGSLAAVVRGSGQVYSRSAGDPASPPLALGLRGLEQVFFLDQYVIGVRGTRIASPDHCQGPRGEIRGAEWRYEGALRHGLPHGQGRWTWTASDRRFEGTFEEGFPVSGEDWGLGRLLFKGSVRKDFTHDSGRTPLPDGSGTWIGPHDERGLPHGRGSFENRQGRVLTAVAEHGAISRPD